MTILTFLLAALVALTLLFLGVMAWHLRGTRTRPSIEVAVMSSVAQFFDTLGIGCMAPTTAYFKARRLVPDELIPPMVIVGFSIGCAAQALIFMSVIEIDPVLLVSCILSSVVGALVGTTIAARLPVSAIRLVMGVGLLVAGTVFALSNLGLLPAGGTATALPLALMIIAVGANFLLGILMNLGIGPYAPLLIILSLMGLDPRAAFPVMMGSSAFLMLSAGIRLLRTRPLNLGVVTAMLIGSVPGVLVAAFIVRSLPLEALRWLVVIVVGYTGTIMLREAVRGDKPPQSETVGG